MRNPCTFLVLQVSKQQTSPVQRRESQNLPLHPVATGIKVPGKVHISFLLAFKGDFINKQSCIILFHIRSHMIPC